MIGNIILDEHTSEKTATVCDEQCPHYKKIRMSQTSEGHSYTCFAAETPLEMKNVDGIERALIGPVYECLYQKNPEETKKENT